MRPITESESEFDISQSDATAGARKLVERFRTNGATVQATVPAGSFTLQGSIDGLTWFPIGSAITANALITLTADYRYLRVLTTTANAGAAFRMHAFEMLY